MANTGIYSKSAASTEKAAVIAGLGTLLALIISPFTGGLGLMLIAGILFNVGAIGFTLSYWTSVALYSLWFFFVRVTPLNSKK